MRALAVIRRDSVLPKVAVVNGGGASRPAKKPAKKPAKNRQRNIASTSTVCEIWLDSLIRSAQGKGMGLKFIRTAVALLLGFVLAAYPVVAMSGSSPAVKSCCKGCQRGCTRACCAAPGTPSAPVVPAPVPSSSQNEMQVMAPPVVPPLAWPSLSANECPPRFSSPIPMPAIPLFERDCCYLI